MVAIVASLKFFTKSSLRTLVRNHNRKYLLSYIFTLSELGFSEFSLTNAGEIRKSMLKQQVQKLMNSTETREVAGLLASVRLS